MAQVPAPEPVSVRAPERGQVLVLAQEPVREQVPEPVLEPGRVPVLAREWGRASVSAWVPAQEPVSVSYT
ncbi:MAG: hypothetical protein AB9M60_20985, partial [Leptothrix sp. (in: b-proteobacteria)]